MNWVIALVLLLWSTDIGDDPPLIDLPPEEPAPASPAPAKGKAGGDAGQRHAREPLPREASPGFDPRVFQAAFRRQAQAKLVACLTDWEAPPGVIGLSATLDRHGRLTHLATLDPTRQLPECAISAIAEMEFPDIGRRLAKPVVTVQWRMDW